MLYKDEESFAKVMKGQKPHGLYLLYGSESFLIESWTKKITGQFGGEFDSFNLQRLDGRRLDCDALFDAVETLPLLAGEKCVLLDDLDTKGLAAEMDKLTEICSDLSPACVLVITGKPGVFDPKSAAGKKLVKLCADVGAAVSLDARTGAGLTSFLRSAAKKQGCELSPELARYMAQTCEPGMARLSGEVAKVCAYAGGGVITKTQIDAVIIPRTEARVFDLSAAILAGNPQRAMELLRDLFYLRERATGILSVLAGSYADLYRVRVAKDSGKTPADVVAAFGYKGREFLVNRAWNSRLPAPVLRAALEVLLDCDRRLKSTGIDERVLLEQTVVQLFALGG